jgi:hypothetical protein
MEKVEGRRFALSNIGRGDESEEGGQVTKGGREHIFICSPVCLLVCLYLRASKQRKENKALGRVK